MQNAILLHGKPGRDEYYDAAYPSTSNSHWFPWLQKQLLMRDIAAVTPEIPLAFDPQYELWEKEVDRYEITPNTIIVGHSCGGGFWLRYLSEHPDTQTGKVVLVAPSLGVGWDTRHFFDFEMDPALVSRTKGVTLFTSDDDHYNSQQVVKSLLDTMAGTTKKDFTGFGHFTLKDMKTTEFPELLEEVLA